MILFQNRPRSLLKTWTSKGDLIKPRAFGILSYLPNYGNETQLFQIGGINLKDYTHAMTIEVYDMEENTWETYKELPNEAAIPHGLDYGCLTVHENILYSVELNRIMAVEWNTWQISQV